MRARSMAVPICQALLGTIQSRPAPIALPSCSYPASRVPAGKTPLYSSPLLYCASFVCPSPFLLEAHFFLFPGFFLFLYSAPQARPLFASLRTQLSPLREFICLPVPMLPASRSCPALRTRSLLCKCRHKRFADATETAQEEPWAGGDCSPQQMRSRTLCSSLSHLHLMWHCQPGP